MKLVDNVVVLETVTSHKLPVERVLNAAMGAELTGVIVIGYTPDGAFYFGATSPSGPDVMWDLEMAKKKLLEAVVHP